MGLMERKNARKRRGMKRQARRLAILQVTRAVAARQAVRRQDKIASRKDERENPSVPS